MIPEIHVLLVNWNLKLDTEACIQSLQQAGLPLANILLVDNASTDGSVEYLSEVFGDSLMILQTGENLGLAGGINAGVTYLLKTDIQWILLLNNDTLVAPDFFTGFTSVLQSNPEFHIFAPKIFYHSHPDKIWYLGENLVQGTMLTRPVQASGENKVLVGQVIPVDFLSGCAMLVHREVFTTIGGFDTTFFMYAEEVDFCWRARLAGFKLACAPGVVMWHKVSLSSVNDRPRTRYYRTRNQVWFYRRYASLPMRLLMFFLGLVRLFKVMVEDLFFRRWELISPLVQGFTEGWFAPRVSFLTLNYSLGG